MTTFGIDLGTTASAIAWVTSGVPTLLEVDGAVLVPSVVYAPPGDAPLVVGQQAVNAEALHPARVLRSAKRDLGQDVTYDLGDRSLTPVDVSAAILRHLVDAAEQATGTRPERVVITVPAWFTQAQRAETQAAGAQAGLDVARLINEPTAAALAHAHGRALTRTVLVYDFGGGTFDVSLVKQDGPILEVLASHGDARLGGDDVDQGIVDQVLTELDESEPALATALRTDPLAGRKLRAAAEAAKHALSVEPVTRVSVPYVTLADGSTATLDHPFSREDLEELVLPLFFRTVASVDQVLADAELAPTDVDDLLLVGGSTALPQVWKGLRVRYGLEGDASIPPRHAVGLGAAVQAAIVDGSRVDGVLIDVAPHPISVGLMTGGIPGYPTHFACEVVTPRNSPLPARHTHLVRTSHPEQQRVRLPVYQGGDPDPRNNAILGEIVMDDLPHAPSDQLFRPIAVTFHHDLDGSVTITIRDQLSDRAVSGRVTTDGADQAQLAGAWQKHARNHDLLFGDPFGGAISSASDVDVDEGTLNKAQMAFQRVLDREGEVRDATSEDDAKRVLAMAESGMHALNSRNHGQVVQILERLDDLLFEVGIYF